MQIIQTKLGIPFSKHYFSHAIQPAWWEYCLPTAYMDCYSAQKAPLFVTEYRHTLITDLRPSEAEIFQNFSKDARSQIRRCEQEQLFTLKWQTALDDFIPLYNAFAQTRGLSRFSAADATAIGHGNYRIFSVNYQDKPVICHFYLVSARTKAVNLLISASTHAYHADAEMRRALGFANRCLHWQGMRQFKARGFHTYDWGGYALNTTDPSLQGINRFKRTFNGVLTPLYNHYSPAYALLEWLRLKLRQWRGQSSFD